MKKQPINTVITVTPNPAVDLMLTTRDWQKGSVNKGHDSYVKAGGKGINVATTLAKLNVQEYGIDILATGWLGDENVNIFAKHLQDNDIADAFIRIDGETRTNVKITDISDNDTTDINFPGLAIPKKVIPRLAEDLQKFVTNRTLCVLAGSLATGLAPDYYAQLIPILRELGHTIILDTSGEALVQVIKTQSFPHIMKPNIHELREVSNKPLHTNEDIIALAHEWFIQGLEILVVSLGADGALFISKDCTIKTIPPKVVVKSTVGAGDASVAGISYSLIQQVPLIEMARIATALSVACISTPENNEELHTLGAHAESLLTQITVTEI